MRIEKYLGRDTREAMARVRAELGADAYILANRRVDGRVELTAALDLEDVIAQGAEGASSRGDTASSQVQFRALEQELERLRGILETELGERSWRDVAGRRPAQSTLRQRLLRLGFSRRLAGSLLERIPRGASLEQAWRIVQGGLVRRLRTRALPDDPDAVIALYGGTGVGKTSSIAKLAGRDLGRHGREAVGLITLDSYRLGAHEQLATFADAVGVPLATADDASSLSRALRDLRGRRIYIDTAGMSQHDARLRAQLGLVAAACPRAGHFICLAASAQAAQNRALAAAFAPGTLRGAIITKADEAQSLGGVIDVLLQGDLVLYGLTDGQRIPEDFCDPDGAELLDRAVRLAGSGHGARPAREASMRLQAQA